MYNLCLFMFAASGLTLCFKNDVANNIIKRKGFDIIRDPRSTSEKVSSAFKDYFYLLIPFYNAYKTIKLIFTNDNAYAAVRESKLNDRGQLIKKGDDKVVVIKSEEEKPVEKVVEKPVINHSFNKDYYESLIDLKNYYFDLDKKYRLIYEKLIRINASKEEKDSILNKIIDVDNKYKDVVRKIMIINKEQNINNNSELVLKR